MTPKADCILFLAHDTRPGAMAALATLTQACASEFDVVPIFDQTHGAYSFDHFGIEPLEITYETVASQLPYAAKFAQHAGTFWPNNIDAPVLWFWKHNPGYRRYWVVEYDVRYSGDWNAFFQGFHDNTSDLLATGVFNRSFRPGWAHWGSLRGLGPTAGADEPVRATLSIYRLSQCGLTLLHEAYSAGVSGHYEVTVPTVLARAGAVIEDIGGDGAYVARGNLNRHYINTPANPGLAPGTFVLRAEDRMPMTLPDKLWNPFKD